MIGYHIELTPDDNGTFLVTCPDLPEVTTFGDDGPSCLANAKAAIGEAIAARLDGFGDIPEPTPGDRMIPLDTQLSVKVLLKWAMDSQGVSRAELVRRLGWHRPQVDRLFDPNHATRLDQYDAAFGALGRIVDVSVKTAA